jgi:methylated-DNA-protein-cysteine methyltransferase-like protein
MTFYSGPDLVAGDVRIGLADPNEMRLACMDSDAREDFESCLASAEARDDVLYFSIRLDGRLVGQILLHDMAGDGSDALVAYHLLNPGCGNAGVATAALELLIRYVEANRIAERITAVSESGNAASRRVAEKCGFVFRGISPLGTGLMVCEWRRGQATREAVSPSITSMRRGSGVHERIYEVVSGIPKGRVSTYGIVAEMAGMRGAARMVGYALHSLPSGSDVPWQRVVNAGGTISRHPDPLFMDLQRSLLEAEGIRFDASDRISLREFCWPKAPAASRSKGPSGGTGGGHVP